MMRCHLLGLAVAFSIVSAWSQTIKWAPLGGWQLVERLEDVRIVKVLGAGDLFPIFKPRWAPSGGLGDFFPAADVILYSRFATSGSYYAYSSDYIMLDDINIAPQHDPSGIGEFRVSKVEIMVYFPGAGVYMIQGYWVGSDGDFPPYPTEAPPLTFLRSNAGPHYLYVPQAGVWRLATNPDPNNEVFTVQTGQMDEQSTCPQRYNFYLGLLLQSPAAWVCGALPGTDCNMDYFIQYEGDSEEPYVAYTLEGGVPATFGVRVTGAPTTTTTLIGGTITISGYTGSYAGRTATIKVKRGTQIDTYTANLYPNGTYMVSVAGQGPAEVLVALPPGLKKKQSVTLTGGSQTLNFVLTNGDVNGDNLIDDADLLAVLFAFGQTGTNSADLDGNQVVDDADLLIVLFNFGSQGDDF